MTKVLGGRLNTKKHGFQFFHKETEFQMKQEIGLASRNFIRITLVKILY